MERLAARASVPPESPLRARAIERYRRQLDRILDAAARRGARVILCEVVSNERDLYPFGSETRAETGRTFDASGWRNGRPAPERAGQDAVILDRQVASDSLNAGLRYLRGVARLTMGDAAGALDLSSARNLDAVPFRAPDAINQVLRSEAGRRGIQLVPTERLFREVVPSGSPGAESFVEHLHPTFLGNARIASAVADEILGRPLAPVVRSEAGRWFRKSALTRLDLALADARIAQLLRRWPYTREGTDAPPFPYRARSVRLEAIELLNSAGDSTDAAYIRAQDPAEESLVQALLAKKIDLLAAHTGLARMRARKGETFAAAREYAAATALYPVDPSLWIEYGELLLRIGDRAGAAAAAERARSWSPGNARAADLRRRASGATGNKDGNP